MEQSGAMPLLQIVKKYAQWADAYQEDQITVAYDTMWEGTARLAHEIILEISRQSIDTVVKVFNAAKADKNEVSTEVFKSKAAAFGCYGWSGESVKILQEKLKEAGFSVVDENIRAMWTPSDEDLGKVPALVSALLA